MTLEWRRAQGDGFSTIYKLYDMSTVMADGNHRSFAVLQRLDDGMWVASVGVSIRMINKTFNDPGMARMWCESVVLEEYPSLSSTVQPPRLASLDPVLDPEEGVERRRRVQVYVPVPHSSELEVDGVKPQQRYRVIPTTVRDIREGDQIFHNGELVMVRSVVMDRGKLVINFTSSSGHMGSRATMYGMTIDRIVDGMKPQERIEMKPVPVKNIRAQVQARYGSI